jgi:hypothetical protein
MIKSSLEFAQGTDENTKKLVQSIPPYDLLVAYRQASAQFGTDDIVLIVAARDEEVVAFEARPRAAYISQAFNEAAKKLYPIAKESAQQRMKLPKECAAFWLVLELEDRGERRRAMCAIGEVRYETGAAAELAVN